EEGSGYSVRTEWVGVVSLAADRRRPRARWEEYRTGRLDLSRASRGVRAGRHPQPGPRGLRQQGEFAAGRRGEGGGNDFPLALAPAGHGREVAPAWETAQRATRSRLDGPILDAQIRKSFKILIGCQNGEVMLSCQGCEHHVYLRQDTTQTAQLDVDRAVEPGCLGIQRPQANVAQQLGQPATILIWLRGLLNPHFQLTEHRVAGDETMPRPAPLVNALPHRRHFAQRRRQVVAVQ